MWSEPAVGAEARSTRRWARRVLPARVVRSTLLLIGIVVLVVGYGRLYWAVNELNVVCIAIVNDCRAEYLKDHHLDIWDAIF